MRLRRLPASLTFRVTLAYLCFLTLSFAVLLGAAWWIGVRLPTDRVKAQVTGEARQISETYDRAGIGEVRRQLEAREPATGVGMAFHALLGIDGRAISANLPSWPSTPREGWQYFEADLYHDGDEDDHEALSLDLALGDYRLIIGRDIEVIDDRREFIEQGALWGSIAIPFLGLLGGWLMTWVIGRRVERVNRTARTVMAGDLSGRVELTGTGDDFDRLSATLNLMLDRIEQLVASVSRVSDSIAHELRTPLARLRSDLEGLAGEIGEAQRSGVEGAIRETVRLQKTFDALLRIARLETGRHVLMASDASLDVILADAVDLYELEAEVRGQRLVLEVETGLKVSGDRNLLFQAVANLVDNAVKFTPAGGLIEVTGEARPGSVVVAVRDNGRGVTPEERARIADRFYRARGTEAIPGTGLGLALVAAVASATGGRLDFPDVDEGFVARLTLKPASVPS